MQIAYEASSIRRQASGVGYYTASLLNAFCRGFPNERILMLSHLGRSAPAGGNLIATQRHSFPVKEIWMQCWVPQIVKRYRPDICHFTNSIAPLLMNAPYVITVHDLSLIKHPEWHPPTRRLWMARIMRPSIKRSSGVLCDSEATRNDLLSWMNVDASRVWVVPLAARKSFFIPRSDRDKAAVMTRYGLAKPFLLFVGNIEPRKNLQRLLQAFRMLNPRGIDLVLAGRLAWLWEDILREAQHPANRGKVHLLDYVCEDDLPALYQSALAFVYPSLMEGFGLPPLEAMASGTPVVASDLEPLASMIGNAGWLVPPENAEAWRMTLEEVISQGDKRHFLSAAGKERAARFSWDLAARQTMKCYESALSASNGSIG